MNKPNPPRIFTAAALTALVGALTLMLIVFWTWVSPDGSRRELSPTPVRDVPPDGTSPAGDASGATSSSSEPAPTLSSESEPASVVPAVIVRGTRLLVEIASTPAQRTLGLSGRTSLSEGAGLLFIFPDDDRWGFWMKDMRFPIDIIWIDRNKRIVHIENNVLPESYPRVFLPAAAARYVLETNAGVSERSGWRVGDAVEIEGFSAN